jgi:endonuclease III-like uncharacterized protein
MHEAHESQKRASPETSTSDMLETIEQHAWVYVLDEAETLPRILDIHAMQWLQALPKAERAMLAVVTQNTRHKTAQLMHAESTFGPESKEVKRAAEQLNKAEIEKKEVLEIITKTMKRLIAPKE